MSVMVLIALAVRIGSPGEVLFRQTRVGRYGRPFQLLKFRTMITGAESLGPRITVGGDVRITKVGRFLRSTKLDELPQIFNVLKGEISLVGPRPEMEEYVACWPEADRQLVLSVRPGISDYAAIEFRNEEIMLQAAPDSQETYIQSIIPRKLAIYRAYVERQSMWLDLRILAATVIAMLSAKRPIPSQLVSDASQLAPRSPSAPYQ